MVDRTTSLKIATVTLILNKCQLKLHHCIEQCVAIVFSISCVTTCQLDQGYSNLFQNGALEELN